MPKAVREVKSFNLGVVTAADDNDIANDAATFSRDIDPNSTAGRLKGRWNDLLIDDTVSRTVFQFIQPETAGAVERQVSIVWTADNGQVVENNIYQNQIVRGIVSLIGEPPTSDVVLRFTLDDFVNVGTYMKIGLGATGNMLNNGEYQELTFTSSNYAAGQSVYLRPQNITTSANIGISLQVTAQSSDADWNSTDIDFNKNWSYVSNITPAVVIQESTFDTVCHQGLQGVSRIDVKLATNPNFENSSQTVDITFTSTDTTLLKAHKANEGNAFNTKTLSFTNADYNTYQTLEPFGVDQEAKTGDKVVPLNVTFNSNGNAAYQPLDTNLATLVRFDTGNFQTNDFTYAGSTSWNIVIQEYFGSGDDDGSGNSDDDGTKGFGGP